MTRANITINYHLSSHILFSMTVPQDLFLINFYNILQYYAKLRFMTFLIIYYNREPKNVSRYLCNSIVWWISHAYWFIFSVVKENRLSSIGVR